MVRQAGRPTGTTRVKKPILKDDFNRLITATKMTGTLQAGTKAKLLRAFTLLYLTGCRISEIINFKTSDITYMINQNEFSLSNDTKTKKPRLISFDSGGVQAKMIKNITPSQEIETYLFLKNNGDQPMSVDSLKRQMNKFIQRVLGKLYSTHSFRQGYITKIYEAKGLAYAKKDVGHKNSSTTLRYTSVSSMSIAEAKNGIDW